MLFSFLSSNVVVFALVTDILATLDASKLHELGSYRRDWRKCAWGNEGSQGTTSDTCLLTLSILFPTNILIISRFVEYTSTSFNHSSNLLNDSRLLVSYTKKIRKN